MNSSAIAALYTLDDLCYLMERLRDPATGCPWDLKQTFLSITPSTIEEAYELVDAIEQGDRNEICEELGDLLFQVIFYSQLAKEQSSFDVREVIDRLTAKLIRRHPHVFPDGTLHSIRDTELDDYSIKQQWEAIKASERNYKGKQGLFDDIPSGIPAMTRALKIQKRAATKNFDWSDSVEVLAKLREEIDELESAMTIKSPKEIREELGDVLFTVANLSRHLKVDPEAALRDSNSKFVKRFEIMASIASKQSQKLDSLTSSELESLWQLAKKTLDV